MQQEKHGLIMAVPKNVKWFQVLVYGALVLDALSVVFQDRTPTSALTQSAIMFSTLAAACMILLQVYFVWLAAHHHKSWPRWALAAALVLAVFSLVDVIGGKGIQLSSAIEVISCVLTGMGLYFSFTGEAQNWFKE
jgi:uncharacterized membrane protein YeiH